MRGLLALSPLLLLAATAPLGAEEVPVTTTADVLGIGTDIPGRMTVPVTIGGEGPYPFTIDTGAERTVISRELATLLGLTRGRGVRVTAMTGSADVGTVVIPSLSVSTAGAERIEAPTLEGRDLGAPGLLGLDSLKGHAVVIDFDANQMAVKPSRKRSYNRTVAPDEIVIQARSLLGQLVVTDASYRGQRVRVVLDTGSVVSMGNFALRRALASRKAKLQPISLTGVTGGTMSADYTQIGEVKIGGVTFQNLPVAFADAAPFRRLGLDKRPALLLGMDALRLFRRVDIDFANREVRLSLPRGRI